MDTGVDVLKSPFEEAPSSLRNGSAMAGHVSLALTPFTDNEDPTGLSEAGEILRDTFAELHNQDFHEAVAFLAEETEAAVEDRFQGEGPIDFGERERFARSHLAPVQFEADQYLASLEAGLAMTDPANLSPEELDEVLDRYAPEPGELSPAADQFIGGLVKKAKGVVRKVAKVARAAGKLAAPLLAPMLNKLRGLVRPLLERVLQFAIGKLPLPLQPKARVLAERILGKAAPAPAQPPRTLDTTLPPVSVAAPAPAPVPAEDPVAAPAQATDTDELADSFDLSLAEAVAFPGAFELEPDQFASETDAAVSSSPELAALAEARAALARRIAASGSADALEPHIEQFVPVLLTALRVGIGLVGRPKVVSFLAGYLAKMIEQWAGPQDSKPLSQAIVDAGLKMVSLEAETAGDTPAHEAGPVALASVVEDTVRRLAEADDYLFEDRDLTEVAVADAFGEAAATYLPQETIRDELQLAPSIGGRFVTRRSSRIRSFAKYSRVPEVAISARAADALPAFRGGTLGSAIRAAGGHFPMRARMHIFQARPGTSVGGMLRHGLKGSPRTMGIYPLTPRAAGVLLREPGLGVRTAPRYLRSRHRIGAGQRLYVLEPLDQSATPQPGRTPAPGRAWIAINPAKARISVGFYLSETDAQLLAGAIRSGRGHGEVLRRILTAYRSLTGKDDATGGLVHEDGEDMAVFAATTGSRLPQGFLPLLRKKVESWALPALSEWLKANSEALLLAAAHPDPGVRLRIRMSDVPGLAKAVTGGEGLTLAALQAAMKNKPGIAISVSSGSSRR